MSEEALKFELAAVVIFGLNSTFPINESSLTEAVSVTVFPVPLIFGIVRLIGVGF